MTMQTNEQLTDSSLCQWLGQGECCSNRAVHLHYCTDHVWTVYKEGSAQRRKKDERVAQAVWDIQAEIMSIIEEIALEEAEV